MISSLFFTVILFVQFIGWGKLVILRYRNAYVKGHKMEETYYSWSLVQILVTFMQLGESVCSLSTTMEHFIGGVCITTLTDIPKWGKSYIECLDECRSRTECTAVNVHVQSRYCRLNMDNSGTETSCPGYMLSKRSDWLQQKLPECNEIICSANQVCEIDSHTESPDCFCRECPSIVGLEHGIVLGNRRTIGARIMYICDNGYTLVGNRFRYCTEIGDWSGVIPNCIPDSTPSPPPVVTTTYQPPATKKARGGSSEEDSD